MTTLFPQDYYHPQDRFVTIWMTVIRKTPQTLRSPISCDDLTYLQAGWRKFAKYPFSGQEPERIRQPRTTMKVALRLAQMGQDSQVQEY